MKTAAARSVQINEEQMGPVARPQWDAQRQKHTEYTHPANDLPVKRESSPPFCTLRSSIWPLHCRQASEALYEGQKVFLHRGLGVGKTHLAFLTT